MAATPGALYHYQDPLGPSVNSARLNSAGRVALRLRYELGRVGLAQDTVVTDIGDELVGEHRVKLIGWLDADDGLPRVTSLCLQVFLDNFRKVVPA